MAAPNTITPTLPGGAPEVPTPWTPQAAGSSQGYLLGVPMSQFDQTTGALNPLYQVNGVAMQQVSPQDLVSERLNQLMSGNSPWVRHASDNAAAYAGARGAGADGSIYQAGAVNALYDQLSPIAQADAQRYASVGAANQEALNQNVLQKIQAGATTTAAGISAGASAAARMAELREQARQFDIEQGNREQNRAWALADQRASARANQRSETFNALLGTIFSDPSYFRDPQGTMGLFNTYMSNIDSLLANLYPEYQEGAP